MKNTTTARFARSRAALIGKTVLWLDEEGNRHTDFIENIIEEEGYLKYKVSGGMDYLLSFELRSMFFFSDTAPAAKRAKKILEKPAFYIKWNYFTWPYEDYIKVHPEETIDFSKVDITADLYSAIINY